MEKQSLKHLKAQRVEHMSIPTALCFYYNFVCNVSMHVLFTPSDGRIHGMAAVVDLNEPSLNALDALPAKIFSIPMTTLPLS